ncbi:MAG: hypothetical protein AAF517_24320 [Planctomycetota bacterium]
MGGSAKGGHLGFCETYDVRTRADEATVTTVTLPYPGTTRNRQAAWVSGNELFLFGGNNSLGQHDFEPQHFCREAFKLHLGTLQFREVQDFPHNRQSMMPAMVADGSGSVVTIGGFGHDGEVARAHHQVHSYASDEDAWHVAMELPKPRTQAGIVSRKDGIWIFGGVDYDPRREESFQYPTEVVHLDPSSGKVSAAEFETTQPRRAFGSCTLEGKTYLVGGMGPEFSLVAEPEVFDWTRQEWSTIEAPARPRISPHLVTMNTRLYLIGGSSPKQEGRGFESNRSVEVYDPFTRDWRVLVEQLPFDTRHAQVEVVGDHILIFSTHNDSGLMHLHYLDPGARERATSRPAVSF